MRTLEQRLKFDHGLSVGTSLVRFTHDGIERDALVTVTARGIVQVLVKPMSYEMYTADRRLRGDMFCEVGSVTVWAADKPEFMRQFDGEPAASVPVRIPG